MKTAFLFPGQGAQHVGMGEDLCRNFAAARRVFDEAEAATGLPLRKLCFQGPSEALAQTDVCQPAIFTVSAAALACMEEALDPRQLADIAPTDLAGLSLGEYTALYAAGSMDLATGAKLVAKRGQLMQQAAVASPSGMVAVIGLDEPGALELRQAAAEGQVLACANFNCPGQIVLSGEADACRRAVALAEQFGARAAKPLDVAGAFHSPLMAPAAEAFREALDQARLGPPAKCVWANVDARPHTTPEDIKARLLAQLVQPVRWRQCVGAMIDSGVERFYEIGPGKVLSGLLRRIDRKAKCTCIHDSETIETLTRGSPPAGSE